MLIRKTLPLLRMATLVVVILVLTACSSVPKAKFPPAEQLTQMSKNCEQLFKAHIQALSSRNPDTIRQLYTDDVVHYYGMPLFVGIDELIGMSKDFTSLSEESIASKTYISKDECLGTWIFWGKNGFERSNPGIEYDLLQTTDGKIAFWRVFYDKRYFDRTNAESKTLNTQLLNQFAAAWSSQNMDEISKLYAQDTRLADSLLGFELSGLDAIKQYGKVFFEKSGSATWLLFSPFTERQGFPVDQYPLPAQGGIFTVTVRQDSGKPCEMRLAILLVPDAEGKIGSQNVYYNADSLLACGWVKK